MGTMGTEAVKEIWKKESWNDLCIFNVDVLFYVNKKNILTKR